MSKKLKHRECFFRCKAFKVAHTATLSANVLRARPTVNLGQYFFKVALGYCVLVCLEVFCLFERVRAEMRELVFKVRAFPRSFPERVLQGRGNFWRELHRRAVDWGPESGVTGFRGG